MGIRSRLASVVLGGATNEELTKAPTTSSKSPEPKKPVESSPKRVAPSNSTVSARPAPTSGSHTPATTPQDLAMVMRALEVTNQQLKEVRDLAEQALAAARQAGQHSTTARATSEACSDGLNALEDQFGALIERLGTAGLDWNRTTTGGRATCTYPGCNNRHHARGLCKKHYRLWRRSQLEDWVGPDGLVPFSEDGSIYKVDKRHAGVAARLENGNVLLDGNKAVTARRVDV